MNSSWTLDQALSIVRQLEILVRPFGYFTSLTGRVLYQGQSDNDLDITINILGGLEGDYDNRCSVIKILHEHYSAEIGASNYNDDCREVYHGWYENKKIDFIFFF
jgi:hypothetical protein